MKLWKFEFQAALGLILLILTDVSKGQLKKKRISEHPLVLIVCYDGFRADYANKMITPTPTLDALRADGAYAPYVQPVYPTKSIPNHHSIATGLYPESHGVVDNIFFDPVYNIIFPREEGNYNDPEYWNYRDDVLPIWIRNEMAGEGRVSGVMMWPGSSVPFGANNDSLPTYYSSYNSSVPWKERVETAISWLTDDTKPANLVLLVYDEPDHAGHCSGPDSPKTLEKVSQADNDTAYLIDKLKDVGIFDKLNLILVGDHGMATASLEHISYLNRTINQSLIKVQSGISPNLQFLAREGKKEELYESLRSFCQTRNCTAWKKGDMNYPYHHVPSRRILDVGVSANVGYVFDEFEEQLKEYCNQAGEILPRSTEYGIHGYTNTHTLMRVFFLAHGPAFQKGIKTAPFEIIDIFPLMCHILKLEEPPNNGSLSRVEEMVNLDYLQSSAGLVKVSVPSTLLLLSLVTKQLLF